LPYSLTPRQREYLEFIRAYIKENMSSPRLEDLTKHFNVKAPTAHKMLEALESKGYLYFRRDPKAGFFIRLIERAGTAEIITEVPITGKISEYGEVYDFPEIIGTFPMIFQGVQPGDVFALKVMNNIPEASILTGDLILFDLGKKPQPEDICIGPIGNKFFLIELHSKTYDMEMVTFETHESYPIPEELTDPELEQRFNWYPLAYTEETDEWFTKVAEEQNFPIGPLKPELIMAPAIRLIRAMAF